MNVFVISRIGIPDHLFVSNFIRLGGLDHLFVCVLVGPCRRTCLLGRTEVQLHIGYNARLDVEGIADLGIVNLEKQAAMDFGVDLYDPGTIRRDSRTGDLSADGVEREDRPESYELRHVSRMAEDPPPVVCELIGEAEELLSARSSVSFWNRSGFTEARCRQGALARSWTAFVEIEDQTSARNAAGLGIGCGAGAGAAAGSVQFRAGAAR